MADDAPPPAGPRSLVHTAARFYAAMVFISLVWGIAAKRPILWNGPIPTLQSVALWTLWGALFGLAVVGLSALTVQRFAWARSVGAKFADVLGPITWSEAFYLAAFSAVGEEMLFRGAMQPAFGLVLTTFIFMMMHWPVTKALVPWTLSAGVVGFAFGWGFESSGHLAGPIAAHFTINLINLHSVTRSASARG